MTNIAGAIPRKQPTVDPFFNIQSIGFDLNQGMAPDNMIGINNIFDGRYTSFLQARNNVPAMSRLQAERTHTMLNYAGADIVYRTIENPLHGQPTLPPMKYTDLTLKIPRVGNGTLTDGVYNQEFYDEFIGDAEVILLAEYTDELEMRQAICFTPKFGPHTSTKFNEHGKVDTTVPVTGFQIYIMNVTTIAKIFKMSGYYDMKIDTLVGYGDYVPFNFGLVMSDHNAQNGSSKRPISMFLEGSNTNRMGNIKNPALKRVTSSLYGLTEHRKILLDVNAHNEIPLVTEMEGRDRLDLGSVSPGQLPVHDALNLAVKTVEPLLEESFKIHPNYRPRDYSDDYNVDPNRIPILLKSARTVGVEALTAGPDTKLTAYQAYAHSNFLEYLMGSLLQIDTGAELLLKLVGEYFDNMKSIGCYVESETISKAIIDGSIKPHLEEPNKPNVKGNWDFSEHPGVLLDLVDEVTEVLKIETLREPNPVNRFNTKVFCEADIHFVFDMLTATFAKIIPDPEVQGRVRSGIKHSTRIKDNLLTTDTQIAAVDVVKRTTAALEYEQGMLLNGVSAKYLNELHESDGHILNFFRVATERGVPNVNAMRDIHLAYRSEFVAAFNIANRGQQGAEAIIQQIKKYDPSNPVDVVAMQNEPPLQSYSIFNPTKTKQLLAVDEFLGAKKAAEAFNTNNIGGVNMNNQWGTTAQPAAQQWGAPAQPAAQQWGAPQQQQWGAPAQPAAQPAAQQWGAPQQQQWGAPAQPAAQQWGAPAAQQWGAPAQPAAQPAAQQWGAPQQQQWGAPAQPAAQQWGAPAAQQWGAPAQPAAQQWGAPTNPQLWGAPTNPQLWGAPQQQQQWGQPAAQQWGAPTNPQLWGQPAAQQWGAPQQQQWGQPANGPVGLDTSKFNPQTTGLPMNVLQFMHGLLMNKNYVAKSLNDYGIADGDIATLADVQQRASNGELLPAWFYDIQKVMVAFPQIPVSNIFEEMKKPFPINTGASNNTEAELARLMKANGFSIS